MLEKYKKTEKEMSKILIMKNKLFLILLSATLLLGGSFALADKTPISEKTAPIQKAKVVEKQINTASYTLVPSLNVVAAPGNYLGKSIKMKATFDKFSTLGLDYKPAFRSTQDYISFLIKRDDVKDHTIPLSEMKIFIKRTDAEKFIDLESGDIVEIYGKVFSTALNDPWIDVDKLIIIEKKTKPEVKA